LIDVLCLPTLREGLPNVALEAQASGVPVITTNATGAIDSVENEATGLVVRTGHAPELAEALARVLSDPHYRATLGSNARPWVMHRFLSSTVISSNVIFYRKIFQHP
jgi:glycosyltransferase involved in cell wall biosynthesis